MWICITLFSGCYAPKRLYIFLYKPVFQQIFFLDAFDSSLSLSRNKTLLYMFRPNKYFIQIQQNLGSDDTLWILFSSHSPILCYPAQSSLFVCLYPLSPMKENWKQRLQLVRQLDSCFVSSTHPLSHTLIAILSSPISHLPFTCSFYVFFSHLAWRSVWNYVSVIFTVMYFKTQKAFIIPSLFLLCICYLSLLLHLSFRLSLCLFISFNQSRPHHPSREDWCDQCVGVHTHTQTQTRASAKHLCLSYSVLLLCFHYSIFLDFKFNIRLFRVQIPKKYFNFHLSSISLRISSLSLTVSYLSSSTLCSVIYFDKEYPSYSH